MKPGLLKGAHCYKNLKSKIIEIISHKSDTRLVESVLNFFKSRKTGDYHENMDENVF